MYEWMAERAIRHCDLIFGRIGENVDIVECERFCEIDGEKWVSRYEISYNEQLQK